MQKKAKALLLQAREHYSIYNIEAGHACIDRAIALDPANEAYLLLERAKVRYELVYDAKGAIDDLTRIIEQSQVLTEIAEARRWRSAAFRYERQYDKAFEDINWVIERTPTAADYVHRAETWDRIRIRSLNRNEESASKFEAMMADYGRAIELDPTNCEYRSIRAEQYLYRDQFEEAINDLSVIIRWSDDKDEITGCRLSRARCFQGLGRTEEWLTDLNWIIEHGTPTELVFAWRGRYRIDQKDFEGALADYNAAIALEPDISTSYYFRAWVNFELGSYQLAIDELTTLIPNEEHLSSLFSCYNLRGKAYLQLGEEQKALDDFNTIMRLNDLPPYERTSDYDEMDWIKEMCKKDAEEQGRSSASE